MDRVFPDENLPGLSRYIIRDFPKAVTQFSIVVIPGLFVTFGSENIGKGQAVLMTEGIQNRCCAEVYAVCIRR